MIQIRFPDSKTEVCALGFLARRFSLRSFDDGTTLVPETALAALAGEGIAFSMERRAVSKCLSRSFRR